MGEKSNPFVARRSRTPIIVSRGSMRWNPLRCSYQFTMAPAFGFRRRFEALALFALRLRTAPWSPREATSGPISGWSRAMTTARSNACL